jgi:hypothetical protein
MSIIRKCSPFPSRADSRNSSIRILDRTAERRRRMAQVDKIDVWNDPRVQKRSAHLNGRTYGKLPPIKIPIALIVLSYFFSKLH